MTATPADQEQVLKALRFGWAIAEMRGRLRTGPPTDAPVVHRLEHALPLEDERTWTEQTIELQAIVGALAQKQSLDVDFAVGDLSEHRGNDTCSSHLEALSIELARLRNAGNESAVTFKWGEACEFFYAWDAKIQDALAPRSFSTASAYQLGRGLAETYWALDPATSDDDPRSWSFLLGDTRREQLQSLLKRLADYFPPSTAQSVSASLGAWVAVAADEVVRAPRESIAALHDQIRGWHDALLLEQTLVQRVPPQELLKRSREFGPVLRAFVPELALGLIGFGAAGVAAAFFAVGGVWPAIAPVLAILGGLGITGSGALAKAKNDANSLFAQLQQAMDADLATRELTVLPARTYLDVGDGALARRSQKREVKELRRAAGQAALVSGRPASR